MRNRSVVIFQTPSPLQPQHRRLARNPIKKTCIVDGNILLRDNLDHLLGHHAARSSSDIVQLSATGSHPGYSSQLPRYQTIQCYTR